VLIVDILSSTGRKTRRFVEPELENPGGFLERRVSTISAGAGGVVGGVVVKVLGGGEGRTADVLARIKPGIPVQFRRP